MLLETAAPLYYNYQDTPGFQSAISPPPSPFSDNAYFSFPISASEQAQWNYHGYSAQSPLLSASASDIPETVRYTGLGHGLSQGLSQGLSHLQEMGYGVQEAFGHDLGYSQSGGLYSSNTNSNYQVNISLTSSPDLSHHLPPSSPGPAVVRICSGTFLSSPGQQRQCLRDQRGLQRSC